jgi:hypothetical protein
MKEHIKMEPTQAELTEVAVHIAIRKAIIFAEELNKVRGNEDDKKMLESLKKILIENLYSPNRIKELMEVE